MRILVVGGGGREHALVWKLAQSETKPDIHAAPGNAGIEALATCHPVSAENIDGQVYLADSLKADLVVVGPEKPLADGLVDRLEDKDILAFGPTAEAAQLESSKIFAKTVMHHAGVPTAYAMPIDGDPRAARTYLQGRDFPVVVKADGLAGGKGVFICHTLKEADQVIEDLMVKKTLGEVGSTILIEDYLEGFECSVLAICDGSDFVYFPAIQVYKRIGVGDTGPNTGGMGAVTPVQDFDDNFANKTAEHVIAPAIYHLRKQGILFQGCLYAGLMITKDEPKVLEFNVRFGDPETQVAMAMLDEDLLELLYSAADGALPETRPVKWKSGACACVVASSGGYPGDYDKGKPITGIPEAESDGALVFHAGTARQNDAIVTSGGRVLNVEATGADLKKALVTAYHSITSIHFDGMTYRTDIGCHAF